jgi:outer membrane lipoprotein-sorting protein
VGNSVRPRYVLLSVLRSILHVFPLYLRGMALTLTAKTGLLGQLILAALLSLTPPAHSQSAQKWTADSVLDMMDAGARDFRTLTASIDNIKYTEVVKDTSTESGHMWFRKKDEKMRIEFSRPDPRTILRSGDSLSIYTPKINRVEEYNLGKNRTMVDQYVLLGFGSRSEGIRKNYTVTFAGEQDLDGKKTLLLELVPKSDEIRAQISKIQVWVDESAWLPLQQKFFEPGSGDYFIFHYSDIKKNLKIDDSKFKPDWPKNATKTKPRG